MNSIQTWVIALGAIVLELGLVKRLGFEGLALFGAEGGEGLHDGPVAGAAAQVAVDGFDDVLNVDERASVVAESVRAGHSMN